MLGMGVRGMCVLGVLLWSGAGLANAQTLGEPIGSCAVTAGTTSPRQVPAPKARGLARVELSAASREASRDAGPGFTTEPERVVDIWTRPEPLSPRSPDLCGPTLQTRSAQTVLKD